MPVDSALLRRAGQSDQPMVLNVVVLRDGALVCAEALLPGVYTVGSNPQSDVVLPDKTVAGQHAVLYVQGGRAVLQDSNAATGLSVNGIRVTACEISPSDQIVCGPFELRTWLSRQKSERSNCELPPVIESLFKHPAPPLRRPVVVQSAPPLEQATVTRKMPAGAKSSYAPSAVDLSYLDQPTNIRALEQPTAVTEQTPVPFERPTAQHAPEHTTPIRK